jgi:hypothetical protein
MDIYAQMSKEIICKIKKSIQELEKIRNNNLSVVRFFRPFKNIKMKPVPLIRIKTNSTFIYSYPYNRQRQKELSRLISAEKAKINHFTTKPI